MQAVGSLARPSGRLRPNLSGPTGHALHSLWVPDSGTVGTAPRMVDLVANRFTTTLGSVAAYLESTQTNIGLRTPLGAACVATGPRWEPQSAGGFAPATIMWMGRIQSFDTSATIFGLAGSGGSNPKLAFTQGLAGTFASETWLSTYRTLASSQAIGLNEAIVAALTARSATDCEIVIWSQRAGASNVTPITANTSTNSIGSAASNSVFEVFGVGDTNTPTNYDSNVIHELAATWLRSMTRNEMIALVQNPWQVVRPEPSRVYSIAPPNVPPTVVDGSASVVEGQTLAGDLGPLATDPDGGTLTFAEVGGPLSGLMLNADGTFTYNAPLGTTGTVSFQFEADDGTDVSNTGTFTITVTSAYVPDPGGGDGGSSGESSAPSYSYETSQAIAAAWKRKEEAEAAAQAERQAAEQAKRDRAAELRKTLEIAAGLRAPDPVVVPEGEAPPAPPAPMSPEAMMAAMEQLRATAADAEALGRVEELAARLAQIQQIDAEMLAAADAEEDDLAALIVGL